MASPIRVRTTATAGYDADATHEDRDVLLTVACDHTDRALEVHGVAWSKNASPDVLGTKAWRLADVADRLDDLRLVARVGAERTVIQDSTLAALLPPSYWIDVLRERGEYRTGTVLISGTVPMVEGVDQFADRWEVEPIDDTAGDSRRWPTTSRSCPRR